MTREQVLLVSGQSANNHARAVSLVDESGLHLDNVHASNSTAINYPSQDGVGKQFTISGPQQTTKESFIGNTSCIVFDGADDYLSIPDSTDFDIGFNWSISWWQWMDEQHKGSSTGIFGQYDSTTNRFQMYKIGTNDQMALYVSVGGNEGFSGDNESGFSVEFNKWEKYDVVASGTSGSYTVANMESNFGKLYQLLKNLENADYGKDFEDPLEPSTSGYATGQGDASFKQETEDLKTAMDALITDHNTEHGRTYDHDFSYIANHNYDRGHHPRNNCFII